MLTFDLLKSRLPSLTLALVTPHFARKKAFLVGIKGKKLDGLHEDLQRFRALLINKGFDADDIIMMLDNGVDNQSQPTTANIMSVLETWLDGQGPGDLFVFVYAGHTTQAACDDGTERDGLDELIMTADSDSGSATILDDVLHNRLVKPLAPTCNLIAFFDTCHSQDLLDLNHDRCNRLGRFRRSLRRLRELTGIPAWSHQVSTTRYCDGYCSRINVSTQPNVMCISACKDSEEIFEANGDSMLSTVIRVLAAEQNPTLKTLMRALNKTAAQMYRRAKRDRRLELKFRLRKAKETPLDTDGKPHHEDEDNVKRTANIRHRPNGEGEAVDVQNKRDTEQENINLADGTVSRSTTLSDLFRPVARWAPQLSSMVPLWIDRRLKL
ncbi:caspase domain-containing protein [Mycena metata]|uniref:Caspase domain-containing protein n=1 Tax=Mycena metata TaxID=1033252 RepID=A0AAD7N3M0_9AGAR|nr:caspase domain-containing protein [Mycena metata]